MLEDGYLNPAFIPVLLLLLLLLLLLFVRGFKLGPGRESFTRMGPREDCPHTSPARWSKPWLQEPWLQAPCLLGPALNHATHTATAQGPHRNPQPAGNSAYLTDFQPCSILYLSTSVHRSCLTDSAKNHTLRFQYDFSLACSPKH